MFQQKQKLPTILFGNRSNIILGQILTFVDKKNTKKLINLSIFFNKITQALNKKSKYVIYYYNAYFSKLLDVLKKQGYIFNYFQIPASYFQPYLNFGYKSNFHTRLIIIYFTGYKVEEVSLKKVTVYSKPSRQLYISYAALRKLILTNSVASTFILNTSKGVITHSEALQYKIGGQLLCSVS